MDNVFIGVCAGPFDQRTRAQQQCDFLDQLRESEAENQCVVSHLRPHLLHDDELRRLSEMDDVQHDTPLPEAFSPFLSLPMSPDLASSFVYLPEVSSFVASNGWLACRREVG
jgi:hypothetical protein